jgi:hypothetical protein
VQDLCPARTAGLDAQFLSHADYDRFLDALTAAKASAGAKNTATAFGLLLDAAETSAESIHEI